MEVEEGCPVTDFHFALGYLCRSAGYFIERESHILLVFPFPKEVLLPVGTHLRNTQRQLFLKTHEKESALSSEMSEHPPLPVLVIKGEVWAMISPKRDTRGSGPLHHPPVRPPSPSDCVMLWGCAREKRCRQYL